MFRHIPAVTRALLLINIVVFLVTFTMGELGNALTYQFGLWAPASPYFHFYQLFTYMFLHGGWAHLFSNMFALWMFGCVIERAWGAQRYLVYYLVCGLGAGLCQMLVQTLAGSAGLTVGASGAIYGILLAFGMTFPEDRIFIFPLPVPIKAKWFVMGYVAIELFLAISSSGDGVAHTAHLGGMLFGWLLIRHWRKRYQAHFRRPDMFSQMKTGWEKMRQKVNPEPDPRPGTKADDMAYNARKKANQEEVDRILDKIRKSGYDSLTKEEKSRLFDASHNQ